MANPNEQAEQSPKTSKFIIAVNTPHGVDYFVDSEGRFLFNKHFDEVRSFSEGLAYFVQNYKWSIINKEGKVIVEECEESGTSWSKVEMK